MNRYFLIGSILLGFISCSSLTTFQTGRTIGKDQQSFQINASAYGLLQDGINEIFVFPYLEFTGSRGFTDRLEARLSASSSLSALGSFKYQFIGDQNSPFALSLKPGLEITNNSYNDGETRFLKRYHLPVHISWHDLNGRAFYFSPKYTVQNDGEFITHFPGFSTGIAIDKKRTYYIGCGYFIAKTTHSNPEYIFQLGTGVSFKSRDPRF